MCGEIHKKCAGRRGGRGAEEGAQDQPGGGRRILVASKSHLCRISFIAAPYVKAAQNQPGGGCTCFSRRCAQHFSDSCPKTETATEESFGAASHAIIQTFV